MDPRTPYDGLTELSQECWRCLAITVHRAAYARPEQRIIGNSPGVFDDIRDFLNWIISWLNWYNITSWLRSYVLPSIVPWLYNELLDPLGRWITGAIAGVSSWISAGAQWLLSGLYYLVDIVSDKFADLDYYIQVGLWSLASSLAGPIAALRDQVWSGLNILGSWISAAIADLRSWVLAGLNILGSWISAAIADLRGWVLAGLNNLWQQLYGPLAAVAPGVRDAAAVIGGWILRALGEAVTYLYNLVVGVVRMAWANITNVMLAASRTAIATGRDYVRSLWAGVDTIPSTAVSLLRDTLGTDLALHPERALMSTLMLYGVAIAAGTAAHSISTVLNAIPTLNWVGAAQFAGLVAEASGFGQLTGAVYGALVNDVVAIPMRYYWQYQFRPTLPSLRDVTEWRRMRVIGLAEEHLVEAYSGLPDYWADVDDDFIWRYPNLRQIMQLVEGGVPKISSTGGKSAWLDRNVPNWRTDETAWIKAHLMLAGFDDMDIDPITDVVRSRALKPTTTIVASPVRAMLREGYWTEQQAVATLTPYRYRPEEIHALAVAAQLEYLNAYLDGEVAYYTEQYRKSVITEQALELALSTIYVNPQRVAQVVARERVRALPTPKRVSPTAEDPAITRLRNSAVDSWLKQYRDWRISIDDLLMGLTIVLRDPTLAQQLITVEQTRFRPRPQAPAPTPEEPVVAASRRQAIASWIKQYRDGTINADELELYLQPLILDATTRKQVVQLEQLAYNASPELVKSVGEDPSITRVRAEYVRGHCNMFTKRLISIDQLYQYLVADGLSEELARATAITQATSRIRVPAIDSPIYLSTVLADLVAAGQQGYEDLYMSGEIDLDTYRAWLATLAQDPDVVTYLADTAELRRFAEST